MAGRPNFPEWVIPIVVACFAVVTGWGNHRVKLTVFGEIVAYTLLVGAPAGAYFWRRHEYRAEKKEEAIEKEMEHSAATAREDARDARLRRERDEEKKADAEAAHAREADRDARTKVDQVRADWAATAETCLSSIESLVSSSSRGVHPDSPAVGPLVADRATREREYEEAKGALRAATVRWALVDAGRSGPNVMGIEKEITGIAWYTQNARAEVREAGLSLREAVRLWTERRGEA